MIEIDGVNKMIEDLERINECKSDIIEYTSTRLYETETLLKRLQHIEIRLIETREKIESLDREKLFLYAELDGYFKKHKEDKKSECK